MDEYREILTLRQKRKKKRYLHWPLIISIIVAAYLGWCAMRPLGAAEVSILPKIDLTSQTVVELPWPAGSQGAIGTTDIGLLSSSSTKERVLPTASMAKLITAVTVLKKHPLLPGQQGPTITLTQADVDIYNEYLAKDGSLVGVAAGEQITEYQALEAMLIPSGNNMADSLAIWAFGSLKDYQSAAQNEISLLGMMSTKIGTDASGYNPDTVSTPTDLLKLGSAVLEDPVLAGIVSKQSAVVPVAGTVQNTNKLLGQNSVVGIKTGHSNQAGACLLFAAKYNLGTTGNTLIVGVIQNAVSPNAAATGAASVLKAAEDNLSIKQLVEARQTVAILKLPWTDAIPLKTANDITMPTWTGIEPKRSVNVNDLGSAQLFTGNFKTIDSAHPAGTLSETIGNLTKTVNLVPDQTVTAPSLAWRFTHPI